MKKHIISLGDLVIDLIVPVSLPIQPFDHQDARGVNPEPGGSGNFMILASRIGLQVSAIGAVGDDLFGKFLLDILHAEDIVTDGITVLPSSRSTLVLDLVDEQTQQHVFIGSASSGDPIRYGQQHEKILQSAEALFLQGYTLHERQIAALVPEVVNRARALNIPVYFDIGPTVRHLHQDHVRDMMQLSDVLMMTEDEVPLAADGRIGDEAYRLLLDLGAKLLVIKQGGQGCLLVEANQRQQVPGFPVAVVDTIGAGDCFDAAFIYGRLHGMSLRQSAVFANAVGAASVQKRGAGRNVPQCSEVKAVLERFNVEMDFAC